MFTIKINEKNYQFEDKITLKDLSQSLNIESYAAKVNNRMRELNYYVNYDCEVEFLNLKSFEAVRVYETSLRYLIIMALEQLYENVEVSFNQCVSRAISCDVKSVNVPIDSNFIERLENKMRELIALDLPIVRKTIPLSEASEIYEKNGYKDKIEILKYRREDKCNIYECNGYVNYLFGYMVPSTGYLDKFKLRVYNPGFVVQFPRAECGGEIPEFEDNPSFSRMIKASQTWVNICECDSIPKLNNYSKSDKIVDLVNMCETKHTNMLAELGQKIKSNIDDIRLIAIAGPSSSGKTTFSHRLRIELMTIGIKPVKISMDDYYLERSKCPLDEDGNPDLEHIEALDIELFNKHMLALIQGEEVQLPIFNFKTGKREWGEKIRVDKYSPIIIEGIHALNDRLTSLVPKHQKFKIYISPLSEIKIDAHNPINASELRLLRRCVRDAKFRKTSPDETLSMWPSVRKGEFKWIYPFQEHADFIFNSELTYELGVMKKYALPALQNVSRNDKNFVAANRLVKFLKYVEDIDDRYVPCNSLLREFIGDGVFNY